MTDEIYPVDPDTGDKIDTAAFDLNGDEIGAGSVEGYFRLVDADGELTGDAVELPDGTVIPSGATAAVDLTPRDADGDTLSDQGVTVNGTLYGNASSGGGSGGGSVSLSVATNSIQQVGTEEFQVTGDLTELSGTDSADVYVEYRQTGAASWQSTTKTSQSSTGTFNVDVTGLTHDTQYEARAVVESGSTTATGAEVTQTTAITVDDWERSTLDHYTGDTANAAIVETNGVFHGSKALEVTATSGNKSIITSDSGLPHYPDDTDPFYLPVEFDTANTRLFIYYEYAGSNNWYRFTFGDDKIEIRERESGSDTILDDTTSPSVSAGTQYILKFDYTQGGTHTVTVYDTDGNQVSQFSGTAPNTITSSAIRLGTNDTGSGTKKGYFDYARQRGDLLPAGTGGGSGN